ncbi:substrate-binding domain-containing protein [Paenarthrobacter sp. Z7-10]|nr:substrate-binding domain-containing protein [Paenarthrobacter sp. Z7-10]
MIADELGIHPSTVSRVLNASGSDPSKWAAAETVQRIRNLATERGYHPNVYAANLRTARSNLVGVIVPRLQDYVLATVYEGIEEAAIEHGLSTFVTNSLDRADNRRARTSMMIERRVGGLIFGDAHLEDSFLEEIAAQDIPFVLVSRYTGAHISVTGDDYLGGRLVGEHLLSIGRRNVAILAGLPFASTARDRTRGVTDVFKEAGIGISADRIVHGPFDAAGGRAAANAVLRSGRYPDAIFATNDFAAIGALGSLRDHGLSVPEHVALVGYNDTPLAAEMLVPLTTVRSPMHVMGRRALELLADIMAGQSVVSEHLKPELIVRASSRIA